MSRLITWLLLLLLACPVWAQQLERAGQVTIHNSRYRTGVLEVVPGAEVLAGEGAVPRVTDEEGQFLLRFVGLPPASTIAVSVNKPGLEVVNKRALATVTVGDPSLLRVFMAKPGAIAQAMAEFYAINVAQLTARRDSIIQDLRTEGADRAKALQGLEEKFGRTLASRDEAIALLEKQLEQALSQLSVHSLQLAGKNLDFASSLYIKAYEALRAGQQEKVIALLEEARLNDRAQRALGDIASAQENIEAEEERIRLSRAEIDQIIEAYELQAEAYTLKLQVDKALLTNDTILQLLPESSFGPEKRLLLLGEQLQQLALLGRGSTGLEQEIRSALASSPFSDGIRLMLWNTLAEAKNLQGQYPEVIEVTKKAIAIAGASASAFEKARAWRAQGSAWLNLGQISRAADAFEEAAQALDTDESPLRETSGVLLLMDLGNLAMQQGDMAESVRWYRQAIRNWSAASAPPVVRLAGESTMQVGLGMAYLQYGSYLEAEQYFERALSALDGTQLPLVSANARVGLANVAMAQGQWEKAEALARAAESDFLAFSPDNAGLGLAYQVLGSLSAERGDAEQALAYLAQAKEQIEQAQPGSPALAMVYEAYAAQYMALGKIAEAQASLRQARSIIVRTEGQGLLLANLMQAEADLLLRSGQSEQATSVAEAALSIYQQEGVESMALANLYLLLSNISLSEKAPSASQQWLSQAVALMEKQMVGGASTFLANTYYMQAQTHLLLQKRALAAEAAKKALQVYEALGYHREERFRALLLLAQAQAGGAGKEGAAEALPLARQLAQGPGEEAQILMLEAAQAVERGGYQEGAALLQESIVKLQEESPVDSTQLSLAYQKLGQAQMPLSPVAALRTTQKALALMPHGAPPYAQAGVHNQIGLAAEQAADLPAMARAYEAAVALLEREEAGGLGLGLALTGYARALQYQQKLGDAIRLYERAVPIMEAQREAPDNGMAALGLGQCLQFQGRPGEALPWFEKTIEKLEAMPGPAPPVLGMAYFGAAAARLAMGSPGEALSDSQAAARIWRKAGAPVLQQAQAHGQAAAILEQLGLTAQALQQQDSVATLLQEASLAHPGLWKVYFDQARLYLQQGDLEKARRQGQRALEHSQAHIPNNDFEVDILFLMGRSSRYLGDTTGYRTAYAQALGRLEEMEARSAGNANILYRLGVSAYHLRQDEAALAWLGRAIEANEDFRGAAYAIRGICLARLGRFAEAETVNKAFAEAFAGEPSVQINQAVFWACRGKGRKAVRALSMAIENGYTDLAWIRTAPSLDKVRRRRDYQKLIQEHED